MEETDPSSVTSENASLVLCSPTHTGEPCWAGQLYWWENKGGMSLMQAVGWKRPNSSSMVHRGVIRGPYLKGFRVSVMVSNSFWCIHSRSTLLFLPRYPKPFPDKSNPCTAPKLLARWRWNKWQSWVNQLPSQLTTALRLQQLLTREPPGCLGMELHRLTLSDGQPHTQWTGRWSSCEESKQQWLKVLGDVRSKNRVCLCFLIRQVYLADTQGTGLFIPLV